jgi:FG-GAP-like repeat
VRDPQNVRATANPSSLTLGRRRAGLTAVIFVLGSCGSSSPEDLGALGAQTTLQGAPPTELQFVRYDISPSMSYSYGFSIYDYDGDGKPDISYFDSYTSGRARLRQSPGAIGHMVWDGGEGGANDVIVNNETFEFQTTATNPDEFLFERHVPLDVNGDGLMDIVGVSNSHGAVVAYLNPGTRGAPWIRRVVSSHTPGPVNLTVADVNGDGRPDVIVAMRYQPDSNPPGSAVGIAWLENTGSATGEWIYHTIDTTPGNFGDPRTVLAADINGDGKVEVIVSDAVTGVLAWYSQVSPDHWQRHVIAGVNTTNAHFGHFVGMGSFRYDILQPVDRGVVWVHNVKNAASWQVSPIVTFVDSNWGNVVTEVAAGDLHHDGTIDVVFSVGSVSGGVTSPHSGGVYIAHRLLSAPQTAWQVTNLYKTESSVVAVQLADFDSTGYLDIVSDTEYQQNAITLWDNANLP